MTSDAPNTVSTGRGNLTFEARTLTKVYRTAAGVGDRFVLFPSDQVRDGVRVRPRP